MGGTDRSSIRPHCAGAAGAARERARLEPARAQRHPVRRRAWLQVAGSAAAVRGWHSIYTRMNRWSKNGVLDGVFAHLQKQRLVQIKLEAVSLDRTIVEGPSRRDGGAKKNRSAGYRQVPRRMDHQDSSGCRGCAHGGDVLAVAWTGSRCARGAKAAPSSGRPARQPAFC